VSTGAALERVGTILRGKYTLDALIGVGGMAAVYRGTHRNGNRVAVKLLHPQLSVHAEIRARFLKEGYVANAVDHPGVVRVLDDDVTEDGVVFIAMELLEGKTLGEMWERAQRHLPPQAVAEFARQLLAVLGAAHPRGIVHRDIKPDNLFVTRERVLKVLDFGIARMRDANTTSMTRTGSMMGTPAYMAREQALGLSKEIDGRTDLWAVGATMFTLISGKYVHEAETPETMMVFSATQPARPLATVAPHVPPPLSAVVDRALAFDKADRYPDAPTMLAALEAACRECFGAAHGDVRRSSGFPSAPSHEATAVSGVMAPRASLGAAPSGSGRAPAVQAGFAPAGVSTTAGLSAEWQRSGAAAGAVAPPLFTPAVSAAATPPARVGKAPAILAGVAAVVALIASVGVGLNYRARAKVAPATSSPLSVQPEPLSSTAWPIDPPATAPAEHASSAPASVADAGAAGPVIESLAMSPSGAPVPAAPAPGTPVPVGPAKRHDMPPPSPAVVSPPPAPSPPLAAPAKPKPTNPLDMKPITL
jgi:serine/threonine-protein kinase